jgi:hypothetical protein
VDTPNKPGPKPGGKHGTKIVEGKVIGRDKTVVPPEEVYKLAQIGCKDSEIASWFGVNGETLRYNFKAELIKGRESLKQSLRRAQLEVALGGNATMLIWLGKNILGQSESPLSSSELQPLPWSTNNNTESDQTHPEFSDTE